MRVGRSILLVAQLSPPSELSAARRVAGLATYLHRLGHRVTVLTSLASGRGPLPGARVVRTRDLMVSGLNWRRDSFQALAGGAGGAAGGYEAAPSRLASVFVPDLAVVGWLPFALARARALAAGMDAVITTSPPHSGHVVGLALQARGLPWVADFRDGWTFESDRPAWPLGAQRTLDEGLERAVARRADALVAVSEPIAADLRARFQRGVVTITNGFDPDEHVSAAAAPHPVPASDRHTVLHAGRMAFAGRSPRTLLKALAGSADLSARIEVLFAGPLSAEERGLIEGAPAARAVGSLDRAATLALEAASDSLLVLTSGRRRGEATQKLFEYLAARKPIIVLGEGTEAARIVERAGAGIVAPADDPDAIAAALRRLLDEPGERPAQPPDIDRYSYATLAAEMAEQVERAIASAAARR